MNTDRLAATNGPMVASATNDLARKWHDEAERRRAMSPNDVTADIFDHCSSTLRSTIETASVADEELSPSAFGALAHVDRSASQVRRWCQMGQIECRRVGRDYRIRRGADVPAFAETKAVA